MLKGSLKLSTDFCPAIDYNLAALISPPATSRQFVREYKGEESIVASCAVLIGA